MRKRLSELLDRLDFHLKLLEAYLIVRDPGAPKSAEAFDGLRQKIDGGYRTRRRHVAQLAELDRVVRTTQDHSVIRAKISEFLTAEGVRVVDQWEPAAADLFEVQGAVAPSMRVVSPAYIEVAEDGLVDIVKRGSASAGVDSPAPAHAPADTDDQQNEETP